MHQRNTFSKILHSVHDDSTILEGLNIINLTVLFQVNVNFM